MKSIHCLPPLQNATTALAITASDSVLFFVVTNFGVWLGGSLYPMTWEGLLSCYAAALPFFRNTFLGNLAYVGAPPPGSSTTGLA